MGDKRSSHRGRSSGRYKDMAPPTPEKVPLMPATALAAMRYVDLTEEPKRVPEITVRKPIAMPCIDPVPCAGVRRHTCGPSPPTSKESFNTPCGLPQCFNEDICTCRCYCGLRKEMMRAEDEGQVPTMGVVSDLLPRPGSMGKVHVARIHGLEPRPQLVDVDRFPLYFLCRNRRRVIHMKPCCRPCKICPSNRWPYVLPRLCEKRHYCGGCHVSNIACLF